MLLAHFQSQNNLNLVYSIIQQEISNNHQVELDDYDQALEIRPRLRGIIQGITKRINPDEYPSNTGESIERQVAQLNKKVVTLCVPGFRQMLQKAQRNPSIRINRIARRPVDTSQLTDNVDKEKESVTKRYERISESRRSVEPQQPPVPDFTDHGLSNENQLNPSVLYDRMEKTRQQELQEFIPEQPTSSADSVNTTKMKQSVEQATPFTVENLGDTNHHGHVDGMVEFNRIQQEKQSRDQAFEQRLKYLQNKRETTFKNNTSSTPITDLPESVPTDMSAPPTSIFQQRNQIENITRTYPQDVDIHKLIGNQPITPIGNLTNIIPVNPAPMANNILVDPTNNIISPQETNHIIIINAEDRPWFGNWTQDSDGNDIMAPGLSPNRYHFPVKFSPASGSEGIASIKTNFRNIISLEVMDVMLSTHDNPTFIGGIPPIDRDITTSIPLVNCDEDDDVSDSYDDEGEFSESQIKPTSTIDSILPRLLPYVQLSIYKYPYLLLNIEEFSGKFYSTSRAHQNMVSRLVIAKHYLQRHGRGDINNNLLNGYFLLKPMLVGGGNELQFYPTPLPKLDTFTLSLTTPDGTPYGENNPWNLDSLEVNKITLTTDGLCSTIDLQVNRAFHPCIYLRGDSILLNQIKFLQSNQIKVNIKTDLDNVETELYRYLNYERRSFTVVSTHYQKTVTDHLHHPTFHNVITISIPIELDRYCCIKPTSLIIENRSLTRLEWPVGGFLLNKSIQPTYTVKITCLSSEIQREALIL